MSFMDLPKRIKDLYSYEGRVAVRDLYMNDANGGGDPIVWTMQQVLANITFLLIFLSHGSVWVAIPMQYLMT
jgi:hypothetical protein